MSQLKVVRDGDDRWASIQPAFDGGMLAGALAIIEANVDDTDPRYLVEIQRQNADRLNRAVASISPLHNAPLPPSAEQEKEQ